ncbi:hypothetical protein AVEN_30545-1, partial [Araneus ventricosus]
MKLKDSRRELTVACKDKRLRYKMGRDKYIAQQKISLKNYPVPVVPLDSNLQIIGANNDEPFTEEDINSVVPELLNGKGPGYDGIHNIVVKSI